MSKTFVKGVRDWLLLAGLGCSLGLPVTWCSSAHAEDQKELARARVQFQQAIELEQAGNYASAVKLFRAVGQVRMTPQVRFHIALCEEKLGRLVAALGGLELALSEADSVGPEFRSEVEANVSRLRERIPKLVIQRGTGAEAATIELDSVVLGQGSVGVDVPLDPGPHPVTARAPGYQPFESTVTLVEGEKKVLEIVLEPSPVVTEPPVASGPAPVRAPERKPNIVPFVVGGVGAATLVASGVFFALRQSTLSSLQSACPVRLECSQSEESKYDRLKIYHYTALTTLGVGLAAVGTGAALFAIDLNARKESAVGLKIVPRFSPTFAGASAQLRFY
ncbi:MAG TPA: PEGA domain-containing protein [Polyangiaceae bacterium]|nr:PEGA domain-containing protein [Polyangiaceae bacterium]